jgi:WXXGXW repeat (2 copies)
VRTQMIRFLSSLLFAAVLLAMPAVSSAQVSFGVSITTAPPEIPVYDQPACPGDDYIWVPGYWSWGDDDYYWVPGTWVIAPEVGYLWTPGYWGWGGSSFVFYDGYWGPQVGFYGGVNYGFGYFGHGYEGGRWDGGHFFYNRSVNNVNVTVIHNVYNTTVVNENRSHVSYNGGNGGINERPTAQEEAASRERHVPPVAAQVQHMQSARADTQLRASVNHGKPPVAATSRPGEFGGRGTAGNGAVADQPSARGNNSRSAAIHPKDLPPAERMAAPNTGNQKMDQKYQQQQDKLSARQDQERQKLQQRQDQEHQQMTRQNADQARQQQVEQKHQQQTQQMDQRHTQQQQQMQQRQQPRGGAARAPEERKP